MFSRIKTYPYAQISARTEEFHLSEGDLVLAVIADDGSGGLLKEAGDSEEEEYSIRASDAEELLHEVWEYLAIFRKHTAEDTTSDE